jgi:hypothetical protein
VEQDLHHHVIVVQVLQGRRRRFIRAAAGAMIHCLHCFLRRLVLVGDLRRLDDYIIDVCM